MRKKRLSSLLTAFLLIASALVPAVTVEAATAGYWNNFTAAVTPAGNVYSIGTASQLAWIAAQVNGGANDFNGDTIVLSNSIDLSDHYWIPIGDADHPFRGTFDGDKHVISDMLIGSSGSYEAYTANIGLFGCVADSTVRDVTMENVEIYADVGFFNIAGSYVGCLVGSLGYENTGSSITDCRAEGRITIKDNDNSSNSSIGGLVGCAGNNCSIGDSSAAVLIKGSDPGELVYLGGLAGQLTAGCSITRCSAEGDISAGRFSYAGGLIGLNDSGVVSDQCYAEGDVSGEAYAYVGGLVGWNGAGEISGRCYAKGDVSGGDSAYSGGLVGVNHSGKVSDRCYAEGAVSGSGVCLGGLIGFNFNGEVTDSFAEGAVNGGDASLVGGLIGDNIYGQVSGCHAEGDVEGGNGPFAYIGGLIGWCDPGQISGSYAEGDVKGGNDSGVGGLVGFLGETESEVISSYARGNVTGGANSDVGGLAGYNYNSSTTNCYSAGKVTGGSGALTGGFAGHEKEGDGHYISYGYWNCDINPGINGIGDTSVASPGSRAAAKTSVEMRNTAFAELLNLHKGTDMTRAWTVIAGLNDGYPVYGQWGDNAIINPAKVYFDMDNPADISTAIIWNSASSVTDVVYESVYLSLNNDYFINADEITIDASYLSGLKLEEKAAVDFEIRFDAGDNAVLTVEAAHYYDLTITAEAGGTITTGSSGKYAGGADVFITAAPDPGYSFGGWKSTGGGTFANAASASTIFTMPENAAAAITASFKYKESGGDKEGRGRRGGSGITTSVIPAPAYSAVITKADGTRQNLAVRHNSQTGSASVNLESLKGNIFSSLGVTVVKVPSITGLNACTMEIPMSDLSNKQRKGVLVFSTGIGSITIPDNMLPEADGERAGITIGRGDRLTLPGEVRAVIGDRPLLQFNLTLNGKQSSWNNPDAPVTVSVPYIPTAEELANPEYIIVWYIDGEGKAAAVPDGRYDPEAGTVTFTATHFSCYAVTYVHKTFSDLGSMEWARKSIEVLASKGIINGTEENTYSPAAGITRADFLYSLVKALGIEGKVEGNFEDISSKAYYYKEIGIARKLGITGGTGYNNFSPDAGISRQDMMVMTERALRALKKLERQGNASELEKYTDRAAIAAYAVGSAASMVKEGLIVSSGDKLNPQNNTTRAEAAVFLYRLYNKFQ
ncbi:MAG TPA: GLUG motif-containing protein [Clostridia bacterium]|nr:GLUG motif-containing protein [Clostridia bacterium]